MFPLVLRNLHLPAIILNTVMMLLVIALIPLDVILGGANVLSVLAQVVKAPHFTTSPHRAEYDYCRLAAAGYEHGL